LSNLTVTWNLRKDNESRTYQGLQKWGHFLRGDKEQCLRCSVKERMKKDVIRRCRVERENAGPGVQDNTCRIDNYPINLLKMGDRTATKGSGGGGVGTSTRVKDDEYTLLAGMLTWLGSTRSGEDKRKYGDTKSKKSKISGER